MLPGYVGPFLLALQKNMKSVVRCEAHRACSQNVPRALRKVWIRM